MGTELSSTAGTDEVTALRVAGAAAIDTAGSRRRSWMAVAFVSAVSALSAPPVNAIFDGTDTETDMSLADDEAAAAVPVRSALSIASAARRPISGAYSAA